MAMRGTIGLMVGVPLGLSRDLILNVLGGVGAVWGGSELIGLRWDQNKRRWQIAAVVIGVLCLISNVARWAQQKPLELDRDGFFFNLWCGIDRPVAVIKKYCCHQGNAHFYPYSSTVECIGRLGLLGGIPGFFVTFMLEVVGGAAPIWGCSELLGWRQKDDDEIWQVLSGIVGFICLVAYYAKWRYEPPAELFGDQFGEVFWSAIVDPMKTTRRMLCFIENEHLPPLDDRKNSVLLFFVRLLGFIQVFSREVLGSAGAIWGGGQFFALREDSNKLWWQEAAGIEVIICFVHFMGGIIFHHDDENDKRYPVLWRALVKPQSMACQNSLGSSNCFFNGQMPPAPIYEDDDEPLLIPGQ